METIFGNLDVLEVIKRGRLRWARHACRNQNTLISAVIEQNPVGGKDRWEDLKCDRKMLG